MTVKGVDVASYQSASYSTSGLSFVFVKVTEGTSYTNPKWVDQRDHGRKAGLAIGYYHFVHNGSITKQGDYFLSKINLLAGDMLALDWEDSGVSNSEKDAWIKHVQSKAPAHRVVLYCNRDYWLHRDTTSFCGDGLWIADPDHAAGKPGIEHAWTFHQYSTSGGIDHNVGNFKDKAALTSWAEGKSKLPKVSLAAVVYGATHTMADEKKHGSYADDVKHVQDALVKRKRLKADSYHSGIFDVPTKTAYAAEQRAQGYHGDDADGVPGSASLSQLGQVTNLFVVTT